MAQAETTQTSWSLGQRRLHWLVAIFVSIMLALGLYLNRLPLGHADKTWVLAIHQILGLLVLGLGCVRILWRKKRPLPVYPHPLALWERALARLVQGALYLLLVLLPLLGILLSLSDPFVWPLLGAGEPTSDWRADWAEQLHLLHYFGAWALLLCVLIHATGAMRHWLGHTGAEWRRRMRWRR